MVGKPEVVLGKGGGASPYHGKAPVDFDPVDDAGGMAADKHQLG
jgi:hypothetical protein